jgi:hypothetical protein
MNKLVEQYSAMLMVKEMVDSLYSNIRVDKHLWPQNFLDRFGNLEKHIKKAKVDSYFLENFSWKD